MLCVRTTGELDRKAIIFDESLKNLEIIDEKLFLYLLWGDLRKISKSFLEQRVPALTSVWQTTYLLVCWALAYCK